MRQIRARLPEQANRTRGPMAWRSAYDFEEIERILQIFSEGNMQRRNFSIPTLLHCIISPILRSQPCDGDTEASKNLI
jgi:hypothetical protein